MKIILFGARSHPYTLRVFKTLQAKNLQPHILLETEKMFHSPDRIVETVQSAGFSISDLFSNKFLNLANLKLAFKKPMFTGRLAFRFLQSIYKNNDNKSESDLKALGHDSYKIDSAEVSFENTKVKRVKDYNSKTAIRLIKRENPDLIILAPGSQIINKEVLTLPKIGTLNAHMGWLPDYRGLDTLEWALLEGGKLGVSIHFVDQGVDTGDISMRERLAIEGINSLDELYSVSIKKSVRLLVDTVCVIHDRRLDTITQKKEEGRQYFRMHPKLRALVEKRLLTQK